MPTEEPLRASEPRQTATEFYRRWLRAVPYVDKSCVASTILMAAFGRDGIGRVWQLGDGLVVCRSKGSFSVVTPERLGFGNETRALGIHRAWSDWCTADVALQERGDAVILMRSNGDTAACRSSSIGRAFATKSRSSTSWHS